MVYCSSPSISKNASDVRKQTHLVSTHGGDNFSSIGQSRVIRLRCGEQPSGQRQRRVDHDSSLSSGIRSDFVLILISDFCLEALDVRRGRLVGIYRAQELPKLEMLDL